MFLLLITSRIAIRLFSFNKILLFIKKLACSSALKKSIFVVFKNNVFFLVLVGLGVIANEKGSLRGG